jgi:hypothetical protein
VQARVISVANTHKKIFSTLPMVKHDLEITKIADCKTIEIKIIGIKRTDQSRKVVLNADSKSLTYGNQNNPLPMSVPNTTPVTPRKYASTMDRSRFNSTEKI